MQALRIVRYGRLLVETVVRARLIVVGDVRGRHAPYVTLPGERQMIEARRAHRSDPVLGVGVR